MKPPDPKEELLQQLAVSLLRDVFASAALAGFAGDLVGLQDSGREGDIISDRAYAQADSMLRRSHTPALIDKIKNL